MLPSRSEDATVAPQEYVLCAAIKVVGIESPAKGSSWTYPDDGLLFCGHRHGECFITYTAWRLAAGLERGDNPVLQGFLTSRGRFVERKEALTIAKARGQMWRSTGYADELFSEDLY